MEFWIEAKIQSSFSLFIYLFIYFFKVQSFEYIASVFA